MICKLVHHLVTLSLRVISFNVILKLQELQKGMLKILYLFLHMNKKLGSFFKEKKTYRHQSIMCGYRKATCYR